MDSKRNADSNMLIIDGIRKRVTVQRILRSIIILLSVIVVLTAIPTAMIFINYHNLPEAVEANEEETEESVDVAPGAFISGVTLYERGDNFIMNKEFWAELVKFHASNIDTVRIPLYYNAYTEKTDPYHMDQNWIERFVNMVEQFHSGGFHVIVSMQPIRTDDMAEITRYHSACVQIHQALSFFHGDDVWFEIGLSTTGDLAPLWDKTCFQLAQEIAIDGKCPVIVAFLDGIAQVDLDALTWQSDASVPMFATPYHTANWKNIEQWMNDRQKKLIVYQEDTIDDMDLAIRQRLTDIANDHGFGKLLDGLSR